jgi:RsiW-degrading membrane proteinase PrsW (M82 family)
MSVHSLIYSLLAGIVPSGIWLWFWLREDAKPEPRSLLGITFLGGILAVIAAIFVEKYIAGLVDDSALRYTLWAAAEEILKFVAVAVIALPSYYNDEPIDAMIYCITAALGFAALENGLFLLGPLSGGEIAQSIATGNLRFIGATLVHIVSSAMIGFGLGYTFYRGAFSRIVGVLVGLSAAIALHAAFNLSIINSDSGEILRSFGWVWGAVIILMVLFEEVKVVRPKLS